MNKIRDNPAIETLFFMTYFLFQSITCREARKVGKIEEGKKGFLSGEKKYLKDLNIAVICDELTYVNFSRECHLYALTPNNWKQVLEDYQIDLFLCESAWEGRKRDHQCWRGRIYKNHFVKFETRKVLFDILDACRKRKIPTVFWNKEDPTYFGNPRYDFVDTALHFQYIFTTAQECVKKYQELGHKQTNVLMFGFSPDFYNPKGSGIKEKKAVFAGSWFGEDKGRCAMESALFDKVINENIPLEIYDRQSGSRKKNRQYPQKYQRFVHQAVGQEALGEIVKKSLYALNINTVMCSETMFARRVYELMASNVYIISGASSAMSKWLKGRYSQVGDPLPHNVEEICRDNVNYVFQNHTNKQRLTDMLNKIGYPVKQEKISVAVCSSKYDYGCYQEGKISVYTVKSMDEISTDFQYFIIWENEKLPQLEKMAVHFDYLTEDCGVRISKNHFYQTVEDDDNVGVLFPVGMLKLIHSGTAVKTKKYQI